MTTLLSRTGFLSRAAVLTGVTVGAGVLNAVADATPMQARAVYILDPTCGGCGGCSACRRHAANALFPSAADADLNRAHPYCKCAVLRGVDLPYETWVALFGVPTALVRSHVDRRTPWVTAALATPLTLLAAPQAPEPLPQVFDTPTLEEAAPGPVDELPSRRPQTQPAEGLRVDPLRIGPTKRAVAIRLTLSRKAIGHARLIDTKGKVMASLRFAAPTGPSRTTLHVPNGVPPGRYRVVLDLRTSAGAQRTHRRPIVIP